MEFTDYFSAVPIVRILAGLRVHLAARRHKKNFYWSHLQLDGSFSPSSAVSSEVCGLLPPRRQWRRGTKDQRKGKNPDAIARNAILRTVSGMMKAGTLETCGWGRALLSFIDKVQRAPDQENFAFSPPKLLLIPKERGGGKRGRKQVSYRCLATFENLRDRVLIGCLTGYIRDSVDPTLQPCCFAFRRNGRLFSHRTAVSRLVEFRNRFPGKRLYVAECDVQKFFDGVNHDQILEAYDTFSREARSGPFDPRARRMVKAYLSCYSFSRSLENSDDPDVISRRHLVDRVPARELGRLYPGADLKKLPLGLPQGGTLSPVLVNLLMDRVDRMVQAKPGENFFYARYCDDMVMVHPCKKRCREALDRYTEAMAELRMPIHRIRRRVVYGEGFFELKSKGPYAWKETGTGKSGSPWVSFLGFQIRYDGKVRARRESIRKHEERLRTEVARMRHALRAADGKFRKGVHAASFADEFKSRLIAMGVGHVLHTLATGSGYCWLGAFEAILTRDRDAELQMRRLDAFRGKMLCRMRGILQAGKPDPEKEPPLENLGLPEVAGEKTSRKRERYYGAPYSYYGVFRHLMRPDPRFKALREPLSGLLAYIRF